MKELVLTGLGNEVDFKTGKAVFTAIFNNKVRIEISKEAAEILTATVYAPEAQDEAVETSRGEEEDYRRPPVQEADTSTEGEVFGGEEEGPVGMPVLADTPSSVYDEDTGVGQV